MLKFKEFVNELNSIQLSNNKNELNEGGNAIVSSRPIKQSEIDLTYEYVIKKILPIFFTVLSYCFLMLSQ